MQITGVDQVFISCMESDEHLYCTYDYFGRLIYVVKLAGLKSCHDEWLLPVPTI